MDNEMSNHTALDSPEEILASKAEKEHYEYLNQFTQEQYDFLQEHAYRYTCLADLNLLLAECPELLGDDTVRELSRLDAPLAETFEAWQDSDLSSLDLLAQAADGLAESRIVLREQARARSHRQLHSVGESR